MGVAGVRFEDDYFEIESVMYNARTGEFSVRPEEDSIFEFSEPFDRSTARYFIDEGCRINGSTDLEKLGLPE